MLAICASISFILYHLFRYQQLFEQVFKSQMMNKVQRTYHNFYLRQQH